MHIYINILNLGLHFYCLNSSRFDDVNLFMSTLSSLLRVAVLCHSA